jgi:hypothetical protein
MYAVRDTTVLKKIALSFKSTLDPVNGAIKQAFTVKSPDTNMWPGSSVTVCIAH